MASEKTMQLFRENGNLSDKLYVTFIHHLYYCLDLRLYNYKRSCLLLQMTTVLIEMVCSNFPKMYSCQYTVSKTVVALTLSSKKHKEKTRLFQKQCSCTSKLLSSKASFKNIKRAIFVPRETRTNDTR